MPVSKWKTEGKRSQAPHIDKPIDFVQKNVIYREKVKDSGQKPQDPAGES